MKKKGVIAVIVIGIFILSCSFLNRNKAISNIEAAQLRQMLKESKDIFLLDVRTEQEYNGELGRLEGAMLIPVQNLESRYHELDEFKDMEMVVYCRSGNRSVSATNFLNEKGFKVKNLMGGIKAWNALKKE
jgi:rhodanese-related sulfurtransferase